MKALAKPKEFFVSHLGQPLGPWSLGEIANRLSAQELITTDFIYDDEVAEWIELNKHQGLLELISKEYRPKTAPAKQTVIQKAPVEKEEILSLNEAWFIQKETHRFGPLTSFGVVKALQEKTIFDFELIWREGQGEWIRIAEHADFSAESIRHLATRSEAKNIFRKREHQRITFMNEVMVHDDQSLWMGQAFQGGEGGAGLIIQNASLQPGQMIKLHFTAHDGLIAFNVSGQIVSKKFVKELKSRKAPVPYGVKFVGLEKKLQSTLHEYFTYKTQPGWMFAGK